MSQGRSRAREFLIRPSLRRTMAANHLVLSAAVERLVWDTVLPPFSERTVARATGRIRFCFGLACVYHTMLQALPNLIAKRLCHALARDNNVLGGMHKGLRAGYDGTLFYSRRHGFRLAMSELGSRCPSHAHERVTSSRREPIESEWTRTNVNTRLVHQPRETCQVGAVQRWSLTPLARSRRPCSATVSLRDRLQCDRLRDGELE